MRRKRRNLRNNRLTKPSNSIDSGNISQPADEVMSSAICTDFYMMASECHAGSGMGDCYMGSGQCCSCTTTGYGSFFNPSTGQWSPTQQEESGTEWTIIQSMWGSQGYNWQPVCQCHFTCTYPSWCQGGGGGQWKIQHGGANQGSSGTGRGGRKGGLIKKGKYKKGGSIRTQNKGRHTTRKRRR